MREYAKFEENRRGEGELNTTRDINKKGMHRSEGSCSWPVKTNMLCLQVVFRTTYQVPGTIYAGNLFAIILSHRVDESWFCRVSKTINSCSRYSWYPVANGATTYRCHFRVFVCLFIFALIPSVPVFRYYLPLSRFCATEEDSHETFILLEFEYPNFRRLGRCCKFGVPSWTFFMDPALEGVWF